VFDKIARGQRAMQVRFSDFTLDTDTRQLRQGDDERHLSPKAFDLLRLLVENRPRVVPKAELRQQLWPATFVSEATLNSLVAEVRDALGETAKGGQFVRTVHRVGYAFSGAATDLTARAATTDDRVRGWVIWEAGQVALKDGEHILGRDADAAVWLDSPTVSRRHARISISGGVATIEDLGSTNGTYVRGHSLTNPAELVDGDEIRLGSVVVKFRAVGADVDRETEVV
jgi:DNA-binding winged helix-turn-helix (wHTH) protein